MIKAAFFDVDGTLISFKTHDMPASTKRALQALRDNGVKLFVATGRAPHMAAFIRDYFDFDGLIALNGNYAFDKNGVIFDNPLKVPSLKEIAAFLNERQIACSFEMVDRDIYNLINQRVRDMLAMAGIKIKENIENPAELQESIYQMSAFVTADEEAELMRLLPDCRSMRWHPSFINIVGKDSGKSAGIAAVCRHYGLSEQDAMAFGDGENDVDMLQFVGTGVAMGNASDFVKSKADYVTTSVDDDGIYNALKHFNLV